MIRNCLFSTAGYDSRSLTTTKAKLKEMLPILTKLSDVEETTNYLYNFR